MKVALIHDHLAQSGGAEKVLKVFTEMFPDAPIYTLLYEEKNVEQNFRDRKIFTSVIQRMPGGVKHYRWYLPLMPMAVEFFDLRDFDLVISDSSAFSKGVITMPHTLHLCYCHTPTRYLWDYSHQYINELNYNKYFKKIISIFLSRIRIWDRAAADRVDKFIVNSREVACRVKKYYRKDSTVIYPPVETNNFSISSELDDYFLIGARLAPYKRVDLVIEAFKELGWKLKIFGDGVELENLKKLAQNCPNIEFLGRVDAKTQAGLYRRAQAFIHPQEEDFGITAVESMASGRPVIAYGRGGALETVVEGKTGLFFEQQTKESLISTLKRFDSHNFDPYLIREHAQKFSSENFKKELASFVEKSLKEFKEKVCE